MVAGFVRKSFLELTQNELARFFHGSASHINLGISVCSCQRSGIVQVTLHVRRVGIGAATRAANTTAASAKTKTKISVSAAFHVSTHLALKAIATKFGQVVGLQCQAKDLMSGEKNCVRKAVLQLQALQILLTSLLVHRQHSPFVD